MARFEIAAGPQTARDVANGAGHHEAWHLEVRAFEFESGTAKHGGGVIRRHVLEIGRRSSRGHSERDFDPASRGQVPRLVVEVDPVIRRFENSDEREPVP